MTKAPLSLEETIGLSSNAVVIGVGGGGDVVGALAAARFIEFCGLPFTLGGLSWERFVYDPVPDRTMIAADLKREIVPDRQRVGENNLATGREDQ